MFSEPERHDIVILPNPDNPQGDLFIKRIVGMPGETVEIENGQVYITPPGSNQRELLHEPFLNPNDPPHGNFGPVTVPEDSFFLLGGHRNNSMDSRNWANRSPHKDDILGKAIFRYLPNFRILQ